MNIGSVFSGSPYRANGTPPIDMDQLTPDYCISLSRRLCPTIVFDFGVERRCSDFWIVSRMSILDVTLISHRNSFLTPSRTFTHLKHHWSPVVSHKKLKYEEPKHDFLPALPCFTPTAPLLCIILSALYSDNVSPANRCTLYPTPHCLCILPL